MLISFGWNSMEDGIGEFLHADRTQVGHQIGTALGQPQVIPHLTEPKRKKQSITAVSMFKQLITLPISGPAPSYISGNEWNTEGAHRWNGHHRCRFLITDICKIRMLYLLNWNKEKNATYLATSNGYWKSYHRRYALQSWKLFHRSMFQADWWPFYSCRCDYMRNSLFCSFKLNVGIPRTSRKIPMGAADVHPPHGQHRYSCDSSSVVFTTFKRKTNSFWRLYRHHFNTTLVVLFLSASIFLVCSCCCYPQTQTSSIIHHCSVGN